MSNIVMPLRAGVLVLALTLVCGGCRPAETQQAAPALQVAIDDPLAYQVYDNAIRVYDNAIRALQRSAVLLRRETTLGMPMPRTKGICDPYLRPEHDETWRPVLDD